MFRAGFLKIALFAKTRDLAFAIITPSKRNTQTEQIKMANYFITSKETSNVISLICRAQRNGRRTSKADNIEGCKQYGEYLGVMECDIKLICDAIKETKKNDLFNVLEEMIIWYRKMDQIAQGQ